MLGFLQKKKVLLSPMNGEIVPLSQVPDEVFSTKMMGDGFAVIPTDGRVVAPADGSIMKVFRTKHALILQSNSGLDLIIHIGLDTVQMNGEGFHILVSEGQTVKAGDPLMEVDLAAVKAAGKETISPVVITNVDDIKGVEIRTGVKKAGEEACIVK